MTALGFGATIRPCVRFAHSPPCSCSPPSLHDSTLAQDSGLSPPEGVATYADGRAPIESLYGKWLGLVDRGWTAELVAESQPDGTAGPLPIIALRSPTTGPAVWILAGIHGERTRRTQCNRCGDRRHRETRCGTPGRADAASEPAGLRAQLALPQCRCLFGKRRGPERRRLFASLAVPENPLLPRAPGPSSPEAAAITAYVLRRIADYPPLCSLDLHEDNLIDEGYIYSQGVAGAKDELAIAAVGVLREAGVPIKMDGTTRFDETIRRGIIRPVTDSSIDELMSARQVLADGTSQSGPAAQTVLVLETPAAALSLERRVAAHAALLRLLSNYLFNSSDGY